jgi:hypothetical protein
MQEINYEKLNEQRPVVPIGSEDVKIRNYRLILIEDIMKNRKLMGYDPSSELFDKLYDMTVDQLELSNRHYMLEVLRFVNNKLLKAITE